jgi:hypothetical protein
MEKLYVRLDPPLKEQLIQLATMERRDPSDQAAILIERGLRSGRNCDRTVSPEDRNGR